MLRRRTLCVCSDFQKSRPKETNGNFEYLRVYLPLDLRATRSTPLRGSPVLCCAFTCPRAFTCPCGCLQPVPHLSTPLGGSLAMVFQTRDRKRQTSIWNRFCQNDGYQQSRPKETNVNVELFVPKSWFSKLATERDKQLLQHLWEVPNI